jgi:hypothetical protein
VRENQRFPKLVPQGRLKLSQDIVLGLLDLIANIRFPHISDSLTPDCVLGNIQPSLRD